MYTLKIVSDREALYQFASYVRVVQGVEDVYVEVGEPLYEHPLMKFYVHIKLKETYEQHKALQEIARLVELGRFTYVHYRNDEIEEAFEAVKYESFKNKGEKGGESFFLLKLHEQKEQNFVMIREVRERGIYIWGILKSYEKSLVQGRLFS